MPAGVDVLKIPFMTGFDTTVGGIEGCRITRCGYTGEDGYEVRIFFALLTSTPFRSRKLNHLIEAVIHMQVRLKSGS